MSVSDFNVQHAMSVVATRLTELVADKDQHYKIPALEMRRRVHTKLRELEGDVPLEEVVYWNRNSARVCLLIKIQMPLETDTTTDAFDEFATAVAKFLRSELNVIIDSGLAPTGVIPDAVWERVEFTFQ